MTPMKEARSMTESSETAACENTDREIYREREGDAYADSVFVTKNGALGINVGGFVAVRSLRTWLDLAWPQDESGIRALTRAGGKGKEALANAVRELLPRLKNDTADAEGVDWSKDIAALEAALTAPSQPASADIATGLCDLAGTQTSSDEGGKDAELVREALNEVTTNGEWLDTPKGDELWGISREVYDMAREAADRLEALSAGARNETRT